VAITFGQQAFNPANTPIAEGQQAAGPSLMFKAPDGTDFNDDVDMLLPVDKSIYALLFEADDQTGGERRLLQAGVPQELKQFWFKDASKV
jgi:hypothetical protein